MHVLILSSPEDLHTKAVCEHLCRFGVTTTCWQSGTLLLDSSLEYSIMDGRAARNVRLADKTRLDLGSVGVVWLRRPGKIQVPPIPEPWVESLVEMESTRAVSGVLRTLDCAWVNHPAKEQEASYKIWQLDVASRLGLKIPDTIVTNNPAVVEDFYKRCNGKMVYKLIDSQTVGQFPPHAVPRGIPTMLFRQEDLNHLDQVKGSVHLFQRFIEKAFDIRVNVVGKKIFAAKIESQKGKGKIDFRLDYSVPMSEFELPSEIAELCLALLDRLGLSYGAIDLCMDSDGQYFFLEVNPSGQFMWLEKRLGMPISFELASLLAGNASHRKQR